jgi:hypothetical protein
MKKFFKHLRIMSCRKSLFIFIVSILPSLVLAKGLDSQKMENVIQIFQSAYPDVQFILSSQSAETNAQAIQFFGSKAILISDGFAQMENITTDDFGLIICHELGHHFGGAPYFPASEGNSVWASAEGVADFWAARTCFPNVIDRLPVVEVQKDDETAHFCTRQVIQTPLKTCWRTIQSSLFISRLHSALNREKTTPQLSTPEIRQVETTNVSYPSPQCRLDTFVAGVIQQDSPPGCWFKE